MRDSVTAGPSTAEAREQRLQHMLSDPGGYFAQARARAEQAARESVRAQVHAAGRWRRAA